MGMKSQLDGPFTFVLLQCLVAQEDINITVHDGSHVPLDDVGQVHPPWNHSIEVQPRDSTADILQSIEYELQRLDGDDRMKLDGLARGDGTSTELHYSHLVAVVFQKHGAIVVPKVVVIWVVHQHVCRNRDAQERRQGS